MDGTLFQVFDESPQTTNNNILEKFKAKVPQISTIIKITIFNLLHSGDFFCFLYQLQIFENTFSGYSGPGFNSNLVSLKGGVHGSVHIHESKYFFTFARYDPSVFSLICCS